MSLIERVSAWSVRRKLMSLFSATERLRLGKSGVRTGLEHSTDGLGRLARSFDQMAAALEVREEKRKRSEDERLRLERRLQQAQKAESLARMAGAIAHNFNNMLSIVIGNLDLLRESVSQESDAQTHITDAMEASERALMISRLMLTYLGRNAGNPEVLPLAPAIEEVCGRLRSSIPENVDLKVAYPSTSLTIKADQDHLIRILNNLITNAVEAIGEQRGEITLDFGIVSRGEVEKLDLFPAGWEPMAERYACVSIADTGCGVDPENMDWLFDPFFSTKFIGRGMGLAVVLGLVTAMEGAVSLESRLGQGATVKVLLPVVRCEQLELPKEQRSFSGTVEDGILVLVVEPDEMVRDVAETLLRRGLGYEVVTACDGFNALQIFNALRDEIGLVLLDLSTPDMDGWQILNGLRAIRPDIRVVLASGYDEAQVMRAEHSEFPQAFLCKPYGNNDLQAVVRTALK